LSLFKPGQSIKKHLGLYTFGAMLSGLPFGKWHLFPSLKSLIPLALLLMLYPALAGCDTEIEQPHNL